MARQDRGQSRPHPGPSRIPVLAGLVLGASSAVALVGIDGLDRSGVVRQVLLVGLVGGLLGAGVSVLREWGRFARPAGPAPAVPGDLFDPWLDRVIPDRSPTARAGDADARSPEVAPGRAVVRPRVLSPEGGGPFCLVDEVLPFARRGERGAIRITGPAGSGKTTALRHLAAALLPECGLQALDEPDEAALADRSGLGLVAYASDAPRGRKHLATFRLAPWGDDEAIEYLLGAARDRCGPVMARLKASDDRGLLEGNPELWRVVLDRMIADDSVDGARQALRRELAGRLRDPGLLGRVRGDCLDLLAGPPGPAVRYVEGPLDPALVRLIRHRPVQWLLAADGIASGLAEPGNPCDFLGRRLSRELVREAGLVVRDSPRALIRLGAILGGANRRAHPMAASLLHATGSGWRPASGPVPRLSEALLDRVAWPGVDLTGAEVERTRMAGADLAGANLRSARADGIDLRRARLAGATLAGAQASAADLAGADLASIRAGSVNLDQANLEGARLDSAFLKRAMLGRANLADARLVGADLAGATLVGATLDGADFSGAFLGSALLWKLDLTRANFARARFPGADLSGCNLEGMELPEADFREARLSGALMTGSVMPGGDFRGADLREAGLAEVGWERARLAGADLRWASFHMGSSRSGLVGSPIAGEGSRTGFYTDDLDEQGFKSPEEIRKADLRGADLTGARIDGVDFYLVDLRGATFDPDQADHLRRSGAILVDRA